MAGAEQEHGDRGAPPGRLRRLEAVDQPRAERLGRELRRVAAVTADFTERTDACRDAPGEDQHRTGGDAEDDPARRLRRGVPQSERGPERDPRRLEQARERDEDPAEERRAAPRQRGSADGEEHHQRVVVTLGGAPQRDRVEGERGGRGEPQPRRNDPGQRGGQERRRREARARRRNGKPAAFPGRAAPRGAGDQSCDRDERRAVHARRRHAAPLPGRRGGQRVARRDRIVHVRIEPAGRQIAIRRVRVDVAREDDRPAERGAERGGRRRR